jgi:Zn-dependent protease
MELAFTLVILIVSIILHEVAHGYMANYLGDPTARLQGRLTLNPVSHIDPIGSLLFPAILVLTNSPILLGWAKPVPYNPHNLPGRYDETLVAFAGPGTNIIVALVFGFIIRFFGAGLEQELLSALSTIVYINILLALFNLIPIPPLDGSKVLSGILPFALARQYDKFRFGFEQLGMFTGIFVILLLFYMFSPVFGAALRSIFEFLTGVSL